MQWQYMLMQWQYMLTQWQWMLMVGVVVAYSIGMSRLSLIAAMLEQDSA